MDFQRLSKKPDRESGIALFMVLASVSVLALLVTEFTYIAQSSQMIAYGGLDQTRAHYLAKSGLKLSLLRLKAYKQVKGMISGSGGAKIPVPRALIEKIWSFPFFYPIPTNVPGMAKSDKDIIDKFQKDSGLEGKFSAIIEPESSKYNLNLLVSGYSTNPTASPTPSPTAGTPGATPSPSPSASPTSTPSYNAESARSSLATFIGTLLTQKFEADPDFATIYRDLRMEDLIDNITAWSDRSYERRTSTGRDKLPMKRAPFYSLSEMHMLANVDDELYDLLAPNFTVSSTAGINVNTLQEAALRALIPTISKDEVIDFFKFRDSEEADNSFKSVDDFYGYLQKGVAAFKNQAYLEQFKADLTKRSLSLVVEENFFKITVQAQVNTASRTIEAWVVLGQGGGGAPKPQQPQQQPAGQPPAPVAPGQPTTGTPQADPGLTITYMRIS